MTIEGTAMRRQIIVTCAFLGLIVLAGAAPATAQRTTATLAGLVVDSSGGALPGATVELVNEDTGAGQAPIGASFHLSDTLLVDRNVSCSGGRKAAICQPARHRAPNP
jgi:hypothetical protein